MKTYYKKSKQGKTTKTGFTLIELSLSIAFIAILSIAIVLIITNTISSYRRGLTLNQINTVGMDLVDDIRTAVQNSPARSITKECASLYTNVDAIKNCEANKAQKFVLVTRKATVEVGGKRIGNTNSVPVFGAFCTGSYSYIWNSGYFFNSADYKVTNVGRASLTYRASSTEASGGETTKTISDFKLLKVMDEQRAVCISAVKGTIDEERMYPSASQEFVINDGSSNFNISSYEFINEEPIEVLTGNSLAIYNIDVAIPAESASRNNIFYAVSFILGTLQGGINIKTTGNFCATPSGYDAAVENFDYCAINKFNFAAQATGG